MNDSRLAKASWGQLGLASVLGALVLTLVPEVAALADGFIYVSDPGVVEVRRRRPGWPRPRPHFPLEVTRHRVAVEVDENLARTRVEETFHNPNNRQLEGTYLFPLPPDATVSNFTMKIGGTEVSGEILERDKARRIYEDIVRKSQDPGLLEYVDRGLFRARVFPIPARGGVDVAVEYSESLRRSSGMTTYRYPLDTGKYSTGPYRDVVIDVRLRSSNPMRSIHCPSHEAVQILRSGDKEARITLEAKELRADKDLVVTWNVSEDALAPVVLTYRGAEPQAFFFLSILPRPDRAKKVPKDIVFVIDTSGSMLGEKLEQVKKALRYCLHNLNPGDRFNIIDFSTEARRFREGLAELNDENRKSAATYIDELRARGGTNLSEGMAFALDNLKDADRLQMAVLLTDGVPTIGYTTPKDILSSVKEKNRTKRRVFVFGVGDDLNAKLLDMVAKETRGVTEYIRSGADLEVPLAGFYDKVDSPVLTDLRIEFPGGGMEDMYPRPLPDLFKGDQLDIFGRYKEAGKKTVVLRGKFQGEDNVFEYSLDFSEERNGYIPRLWATRKIGYLLEQMRLSGETKEVKDEVIRLSKLYGIITPFTSYLILEEGRLARRLPERRRGSGAFYYGAASDALAPRSEAAGETLRERARGFDEAEGEAAVGASRSLGALKLGKAEKEVDAFIVDQVNVGGVRIKRVEGYTFYLQKNRWIDSRLTEKQLSKVDDLRRIKYLSEEYFALLKDEPGIGKLLSVGREVSFLWQGKVVSID